MKSKLIHGFTVLLVALGFLAFSAGNLQAQSCSVTVSLTAAGTSSSACFVPHGQTSYIQVTGTWVGTATIQRSDDGGASYQNQDSTTANASFTLNPRLTDSRYRVQFSAVTSGTLAGSIVYNVNTGTRLAYSTVPIGSVAYSSFGTSVSVTASTSLVVSDLDIPAPFNATGLAVLIGATTGTNTVILSLYDVSGSLVTNTPVAGTLTGTANAFQRIDFASQIVLPAGHYYLALQMNGITDKYRAIAASTFVIPVGATLTGSAFGTQTPVIVPPTTFTANAGPIGYVY